MCVCAVQAKYRLVACTAYALMRWYLSYVGSGRRRRVQIPRPSCTSSTTCTSTRLYIIIIIIICTICCYIYMYYIQAYCVCMRRTVLYGSVLESLNFAVATDQGHHVTLMLGRVLQKSSFRTFFTSFCSSIQVSWVFLQPYFQ